MSNFIYSEFLNTLSLTDKHLEQLLNRGFTLEQVSQIGFKTMPAEGVSSATLSSFEKFVEASNSTLEGVAGFFKVEGIKSPRIMRPFIELGGRVKKPTFAEAIIIPIRDINGQITSLKFRVNTTNPAQKYLSFSSKNKLQGGVVVASPHFSFFKQSSKSIDDFLEKTETVRITEGEFKAEIATLQTDIYTISMGGVSHWDLMPNAIKPFKNLKTIHLAPDSDYKSDTDPYTGEVNVSKNQVKSSFFKLKDKLVKLGYTVLIEDWDKADGKGIDDVLKNNGTIRILDQQTVEKITDEIGEPQFPHVIKGKTSVKILNTQENFNALCEFLKVKFCYNQMSHKKELLGDRAKDYHPDYLDVSVSMLQSKSIFYGLNPASFPQYADNQAMANKYHPAKQWLESKEWDGVERYEALLDTLVVDPSLNEVKDLYLKKWLVGGVAALYAPNYWTKLVLVLVGDGSIGKTSWFNRLFGQIGDQAFKDGVILDPNNKDSRWNIVSRWCIELGEIGSTFKKSDMDSLKACITEKSDYLRKPYGREAVDYKRQCFFGGSVDRDGFLNDEAGSVRFACLKVDKIEYLHEVDMQQLWAEVKVRFYDNGETWFLDSKQTDELKEANTAFDSCQTSEEAEILKRAYGDKKRIDITGGRFMMASEVNDELINMGYIQRRFNTVALGKNLKRMFPIKEKSNKMRGVNSYYLPTVLEMGGVGLELVPDEKKKENHTTTDKVLFPEIF